MTKDDATIIQTPEMTYDKNLEKLRDKVLFPEKLAKAKEILAKGGLPKKKKQ